MDPARDPRPATPPAVRVLAAACVLLALMCVALAFGRKADEAACYRQALADGETPAIADTDGAR